MNSTQQRNARAISLVHWPAAGRALRGGGSSFTERFPGVKVNVVRSTAQVAFQRLAQDMRARVAQCDVFSSTDYSHFTFLKREDRLLPYRPRNAEGMVKAARDAADPDGHSQI